MTESGATAVRILRTLVATLVVVGLGGSAHVLGGGAGLAPIPVAILLVLVGPLVWLLVRSRTSLPRMLLATGAGQVVAHLALMGMEPTADGTAVAPHVHDAVDMSGGRSTSPVALHLTGSMVLAHALATVAHAQRRILAGVADLARVRWVQRGFREPHEGPGVPMRNLLGQVDGTVQPDVAGLDAPLLWVGDDAPAWLRGGSSMVVRRIAMDLDAWDRVDRASRENAIGRRLDTGAPVTGTRVDDAPDLEAVDDRAGPDPGAATRVLTAARSREGTHRLPVTIGGHVPQDGWVQTRADGEPTTPEPSLGPVAAGALVFGASAAVLVVELVALRLVAPYLGLTLETSTLVIGVALAAIATGAWAGGRAADTMPPRRALGPLLAVSGVAVAATPFLVRGAGEAGGAGTAMLTAMMAILVPGAFLSAVPPMVTKLRLTDLAETGTVVGRLSGIGTVGAIAGTVLTGFVFVVALPVSAVLVGLGVLLVVAAVLVEVRVRGIRAAVLPAVLLVPGALGAAFGPGQCDAETVYHCASVQTDVERPGGRLLVLDGLWHSYVDLDDPTHLEFEYVRAMAAVTDTAFPAEQPLTAYHLGGGGLTLPRYLSTVRPGTRSVVSEIDPGVVELDEERLGLVTGSDLEVRVEDARLGLHRLDTDSRDLVVGDAFGGVSVPWHLTTREAISDVARVVRPDGLYAANLIDNGPLAFARAEVATIREAFGHVAVAADPVTLARGPAAGGNIVVVASDEPLDLPALRTALSARDLTWGVLDGPALDAWVGDARVLTDDHAPVDQLLTPHATPVLPPA